MTIKVPEIYRCLIDGDIICNTASAIVEPTWWLVQVNGVTLEEFRYKKDAEGWVEQQPQDKRSQFQLVSEKRLEPVEHAIQVVKVMIEGVLEGCNAVERSVYLTSQDKSNFRFKIAKSKPYKGNRTGEKPTHFQACYDYLASRDYTHVVYGMEADDYIAMEQTESINRIMSEEDSWSDRDLTCICSTDKDFKQVPGYHYNLTTKEITHINPIDATYNLCFQWLVGDGIDNIPGLPGVGKAKAKALLDLAKHSHKSMFEATIDAYKERGVSDEYMQEQLDLVYLLRSEEEYETIVRKIEGA